LDGSTGDLVNFSNGTLGGDVSAAIETVPTGPSGGGTVVPVPAAVWMALPMLAILAGAKILRRNFTSISH